jgi:Choline/ethanolamine kinase
MSDRSALGSADVTDDQLASMVADLLGAKPEESVLIDSTATEFPYDLPAITTAGRYWVSGTAEVAGKATPFRMFVKHVQSWARHPFFDLVPHELRDMAASGVPWRTEALAYRSDLGDRLPDGLTMPRAVGVFDIDEESSSVWMEEVPVAPVQWDLARYARAAHLLGRLAVSPKVEKLRDVGEFGWELQIYFDGRLSGQVLPMLGDEGVWQHPLVRGAFDDALRARLLEAADRAPAYTEELAALPIATAHGDACPNNLLAVSDSDDFVLIDYGFWGPNPIGFDLAQLLVGDAQVGKCTADTLQETEDVIVPAYLEGLRAEGCAVPEDVVRRAHALQLLLFTGLSTLPFEYLDSAPTPELHQMAAERAKIARFSLGLLDATA